MSSYVNAKPLSIPADPHVILEPHKESTRTPNLPFREAVGSLMFVAIVSRPDIMFAVSRVSRHLHNYGQEHWNEVKRIIRYLKGTINFGISYKKSIHPLQGYTDADFARDQATRKSTSGYTFILSEGAVTWSSQKQSVVSLSTTEAEYVAASSAVREANWLCSMLEEIQEPVGVPVLILIDNQSAIRVN